jgi:hypothetical protein
VKRETLAVHRELFAEILDARLGRDEIRLVFWLIAHYDLEEGVVVDVPTVAGELHRHPRTVVGRLETHRRDAHRHRAHSSVGVPGPNYPEDLEHSGVVGALAPARR